MWLYRIFAVPVLLSATLLGISNALADFASFDAVRDNTLYEEGGGSLSNGAGDYMFAGRTASSSTRRAVIAFNLSSLPSGAIVNSATLTLFMSKTSAGNVAVNLHRLESDWGESFSDAPDQEGGGASAEIGDATWNHTFWPDSFWNTPGGDFVADASAAQMVGGIGSYSWTSESLTADVQGWLDGSTGNFGWAILGDESGFPTTKRFNTRENNSGSPVLTIEFTVIPEPSAVGLMAILAATVLMCRRQT